MSAPDNPHAFPVAWGGDLMPEHGMTLRDHFAGQALTGILANSVIRQSLASPIERASLASNAYAMADAMLAERARA